MTFVRFELGSDSIREPKSLLRLTQCVDVGVDCEPELNPVEVPRQNEATTTVQHSETDAEVIARSLDQPQAFAEVFERHAPAVHRYLSKRVGAVADDLLADTYVEAFRYRARYDLSRPLAIPWLLGIATNLMRNHVRSESRRLRAMGRLVVNESMEDLGAAVADRVDAQSARHLLAAALGSMSLADKDAVLLLAWGQLSYAEIAIAQQVPIGTVRSRLNRARRILRDHLVDLDPSGGASS